MPLGRRRPEQASPRPAPTQSHQPRQNVLNEERRAHAADRSRPPAPSGLIAVGSPGCAALMGASVCTRACTRVHARARACRAPASGSPVKHTGVRRARGAAGAAAVVCGRHRVAQARVRVRVRVKIRVCAECTCVCVCVRRRTRAHRCTWLCRRQAAMSVQRTRACRRTGRQGLVRGKTAASPTACLTDVYKCACLCKHKWCA